MKTNMAICALAFTLLNTTSCMHASKDINAFPPPEAGMIRKVLELPKKPNEALYQVQLIVGKIMETDSVNRHFLSGAIQKKTIEGWGYPCYVVESLGPIGGTLMAPPPGQPKIEKFVTLGGEPYLIPYNSRLPVVVYIPEDSEVRYRIWSAEEETMTVTAE